MLGSYPAPGLSCRGSLCCHPLVTALSSFGNQTPSVPRIRCPLPPSPSLYMALPPLCALLRVPPSCPQPACPLPSRCPHLDAPVAAPNSGALHSPTLGQLLMLLHCAVSMSGFQEGGLGVVMGWAECGDQGGVRCLSLMGSGRLQPVLWLGVGPPHPPPVLAQCWVRAWCCPDSHLYPQGQGQDLLCCEVACTNNLLLPPLCCPWPPTGNGKCPPLSPGSQTHVGAKLGVLQAAELVPVPLHGGVVLCSTGITGSGAGWGSVPAALQPLGPQSSAGETPPWSAASGSCISFLQSLVQSRKAGITSALASSTLNNEELVGAGLGWRVGSCGGRAGPQLAGSPTEGQGLCHTSILL